MTAAYLVRRTLSTCLVVVLASIIIFAITNLLPGDAASMVLGEHATPEDLAAVRERLGLDQNAVVRYLHWLGGVVRGDLGTSMSLQQPVAGVIGVALGRSLTLALAALLCVIVIAIPLGVWAAARQAG